MCSAMSSSNVSFHAEARRTIDEGRIACQIAMLSAEQFSANFPGEKRPSKRDRRGKSPYRNDKQLQHKNTWWLTGFYEEQGRQRALRGKIDLSSRHSEESFADKCRARGFEASRLVNLLDPPGYSD